MAPYAPLQSPGLAREAPLQPSLWEKKTKTKKQLILFAQLQPGFHLLLASDLEGATGLVARPWFACVPEIFRRRD